MNTWNQNETVVRDKDVPGLIGCDIVAFHIAEGGAMGVPAGVLFVTSDKQVYLTNYDGEITWGNLLKVFPPLAEFDWGLFGRGVRCPSGWHYEYLGCGNHLLVKSSLETEFLKAARALLDSHPRTILYNLWVEAILSVLP